MKLFTHLKEPEEVTRGDSSQGEPNSLNFFAHMPTRYTITAQTNQPHFSRRKNRISAGLQRIEYAEHSIDPMQ